MVLPNMATSGDFLESYPWMSWWSTSICILAVAGTTILVSSLLSRPPFPSNAPPLFDAYPLVGAFRFFTDRNGLLSRIAGTSLSGQGSFYYGKHQIIGLSGGVGRKVFFDNRDLALDGGYVALFGGAPRVPSSEEDSLAEKIKKSLSRFMRRESLVDVAQRLAGDCKETMERLAKREIKIMDPFDDLYKLIYQLTMRAVGCTEIAEDPKMISKTLAIFRSLEGANPATRLVLPWLPTPGHIKRLVAGFRMYLIIKRIIDKRTQEGRRENDPLQMLLDQAMALEDIVGVVISALFAGQINSGINAGWMLCFLAQNEAWKRKIRGEVDGVVSRHRTSSSQTPADVLSTLQFEDWEASFPLVDLALKETIRFTMTGTGFRQNSGKEISIGTTGEVIPRGAYAVYLFDDLMMDKDLYEDPLNWDPGRYEDGRWGGADEKKSKAGPHGYIGWGSGLHPCLGIKVSVYLLPRRLSWLLTEIVVRQHGNCRYDRHVRRLLRLLSVRQGREPPGAPWKHHWSGRPVGLQTGCADVLEVQPTAWMISWCFPSSRHVKVRAGYMSVPGCQVRLYNGGYGACHPMRPETACQSPAIGN